MSVEVIAADSETAMISEGCLAPALTCVSSCGDDFKPQLFHQLNSDCEDFLVDLFKNRSTTGANFAFDAAVFAARYPHLLGLIFTAYREGRIRCVRLNQRLIDIALGTLNGFRATNGVYHKYTYSLDALHQRHGHGALEKNLFRLGYGELREVPLDAWNEGQRKYPLDDAAATKRVDGSQQAWEYYLKDGPAQARAAFALHLISCRGMITDRRACQEFIESTKKEIETAKAKCTQHGLVKADGKRSLKDARARMKKVCEENGLEISMTDPSTRSPNGEICLDAEACRDTGDEVLKAYATYTSANSLLKKAELLLEGSKGPLQTSFEPLLETGRTSSRAPGAPLKGDNFQNMRRAPGMRECFIPRPGFLFCSVDYDMAELRTVSQICIWLFGESKLADALNSNKDVHCVLAAELLGVSYEEMFENRKLKDSKYYRARQNAKNGNFMLWGGSGWKKFLDTVNAAAKNKEDRIDEALAQQIKRSWERAWKPKPYFDWVSGQLETGGGLATIKQFISERVRGHVDYSTCANTYFQGLAADAAKSALLPIAEECYWDKSSVLYGSRPVLFIHDEFFVEVKADRAHDAAHRVRDIAVDCFNKYTPDVKVTASPALMERWYKNADPLYKDGVLVPWSPT